MLEFLTFVVRLIAVCGYITHIVWFISIVIDKRFPVPQEWIILIFGMVVPELCTIHGIMMWFGYGVSQNNNQIEYTSKGYQNG